MEKIENKSITNEHVDDTVTRATVNEPGFFRKDWYGMRMNILLKRKTALCATVSLIVTSLGITGCSKAQMAQPVPPEVQVVQVEQKWPMLSRLITYSVPSLPTPTARCGFGPG